MLRAGTHALLSHWRHRPFQLFTLILGLALATALWSGVQAINAEARSSFARAAGILGGDRLPALVAADGGTIAQATYIALRRAGWQVTPVVEGSLTTAAGRVRLVGIDPMTAPAESSPAGAVMAGDPAAFITPPGRIMVNPVTARRLAGADLPEPIEIDGLAPGIAFADIGIAQSLLGLDGQLSRLIVLPDQPLARPALAEIAPDLRSRAPQTGDDLARLTDSFRLNLTAFGLLSFAVGLFIVHGAIGLAFEQRRPVFRTLRALGLPVRGLIGLLVAELTAFALIAGAIGIGLGYLIAAALLPDVAATLRGLYGANVEGVLTLRPVWWAAGMGIAVLGTALAAAGSLWRVAWLPVLAPARPRAWARASEAALWLRGAAALALGALALGAGLFGSGLVAGFAMLGAMLLSAALALPVFLWIALAAGIALSRGPVTRWFWADTRQQLPGLSLALMALLLALATNIGVGTMVSSFRLTFTGWLDQRLASELYITAEDEAQVPDLLAFLDPLADAVLPIWHVRAPVAGLPAEIYGVADHPTYRDNWPMLAALPDVWSEVANGTGALVNEQLALREGYRPGDTLTLPGNWRVPVAGIYSDYGNPLAQVIISTDQLTARFTQIERLQFGLRLPAERAEPVTRALIHEFGLPAENVIDQAAIKAFSLDVFERTFAVTAALNVLTLTVAGFAILTSLLTLAAMRLPQLAPVWALGLTRARLAWLELARALLLAVLTIAAAIPVGLALAWVLLTKINVEAFGWRLPMHLFPRDWLILAGLSLVAAGLASLWPARKLARIPAADLLKVFANER